ncbi:MAG: UspA domain protein [Micrococcaceae bacterium]|jgi:nucleotide-binding universal stress UspA family protein|nr:UspA domain protein [Micrococcaceae bacterium]
MDNQSTSPARRVVVGVDGSDYSSKALQLAGAYSTDLHAGLDVVTCLSRHDFYFAAFPPTGDLSTELEEEARRGIEELLDRTFGTRRPADVHIRVHHGSATSALVEESRQALLLVVGRRGRGAMKNQIMGSVSAGCASHAYCPVLIVGDGADNTVPSPNPAEVASS